MSSTHVSPSFLLQNIFAAPVNILSSRRIAYALSSEIIPGIAKRNFSLTKKELA